MGRVTIFGSDECPHCTRAKGGLRARDIPFIEIDLIQHPYRRNDMLSLTNEYSIPQVFINEKHIGGADELLQFLNDMDMNSNEELSSLEVFEQEFLSKPDPSDQRLRVPTPEEEQEADDAANPKCFDPIGFKDTLVDLPNGEKVTVAETNMILDQILDIEDRTFNARTYLNCFVNTDAINAISDRFECKPEIALRWAIDLQNKYKIIDHVSGKYEFTNDGHSYFRLQCYNTPQVLNSYRIWTRPVKAECANMMLLRLRKLLGQILTTYTDDEDGLVDYVKARKDERYPVFEEAICVVQGTLFTLYFLFCFVFCHFLFVCLLLYLSNVTNWSCLYTIGIDMAKMDEQTRLAFGLNLYNLMISYAFVKMGVPTSSMGRNAFFSKVKFNVGGLLLSFNDLENGVLRANTRHPYAMSVPFAKDDPRLVYTLSKLDPRIHFGLNCGAKSCPPVKYFRANTIDEELQIVSVSFCEKDETCFVDEDKHELHLSMLLKWFKDDFLTSKDEKLPEAILRYLTGNKHAALARMIERATNEKRPINIKYMPYDWSTNASEFLPFKVGKSDKFSPQALLRFEGKWNLRHKTPAIKSPKLMRRKVRRASVM